MKYRVTVDGQEKEIDVQISPSGALSVAVDGARSDADIVRVPGGVNIILGGRVFDLAFGGKAEARHVALGEDRVTVSVQNERARSQKRGGGMKGAASKEIRSPMPGRVVKVLVAVGDEVAPNTPVIVIEAMKMENELRATAGGKVESIHAKAGDTVEGNALLVKFAS